MTTLLPPRGEVGMSQSRKAAEPDTRLAKAFAHPLRVRILRALSDEVSSPNQLSQDLDEPLGNVSYHVKTLLGQECVELVKTEPRRGAVEHFYRATDRGNAAVSPPVNLTVTQRELLAGILDNVIEKKFETLTFSKAGESAVEAIRDAVKP